MADETAEPMTDNQALNGMVAELLDLNNFLAGKYDRVTGDGNPVLIDNTHTPYLRGANVNAVKTVVTNFGPNAVMVRENGVLCLTVPANATVALPLSGAGPLRLTTAAGQSASVAVATYAKNPPVN